MAHLPAMALLFAHDANQTLAIVVAGRAVDQFALLFRRAEFGVALIKDQMEQRVAHVLGRHVENLFEFFPAL